MKSSIKPLFGTISHDREMYTVEYNDHFKDDRLFQNCSDSSHSPAIFQHNKECFGIDFSIIDWSSTSHDEGFYFALFEHFDTPHIHAAKDYLAKVQRCTEAKIITINQAIYMYNLQTI